MILPHPESDLSLNVMVMAADIVCLLNAKKDFVFEETLMKEFIKNDKRRTPDMFVDSATFLYSFGFIEQSGHRLRLSEEALKKPEQLTFELGHYA